MNINYETFEAMTASVAPDGTIAILAESPSKYKYSTSASKWIPFTDGPFGYDITNPDTITKAGYYVHNNTQVIPVVPVSDTTDTLITKCASLSLLCKTEAITNVGKWFSYVDSYGSTVTPAPSFGVSAFNNKLDVVIVTDGDSATGKYPYAGVGFDFYDTGTTPPSSKPTVDISTYTGLKITYTSTTAIKFKLNDRNSDDGKGWYVTLPIALTSSTVSLTWNLFAQPEWAYNSRPLALNATTGVNFHFDTQDSGTIFTVYEVSFIGTGAFYPCGTSISEPATYQSEIVSELTSWFTNFYVENTEHTMGRIKWISGDTPTPLLSVSEGISYGLLFAVYGTVDSSSIFKTYFDRLYAYWNYNCDIHGLMNWQVSEFTKNSTDNYSATDADLNTALALLLMYEKVLDNTYLNEARSVMARIYLADVYTATTNDGAKLLLAPGDSWTTHFNPSYVNLLALKMFQIYDDNVSRDWTRVYTDNLWLLKQNQTLNTACYGLPSNWCDVNGNAVAGTTTTGYGYDACRVIKQLAYAYNTFKDPEVYEYLKVIATNATLIQKLTSVDPIAECALTIDVDGVAGVDANINPNSVGMGSLLPAFMICSTITESALTSNINLALSNTAENSDYFFASMKLFYLSSTLKSVVHNNIASDTNESSYIIDFPTSATGDSKFKLQLSISETGVMKYRSSTTSTWGEYLPIPSNGGNPTQGNQGFQGNQGNNGSNGTNGNQGNQGFQGNQGNNGSNGTNGNQGNQGFQGNQGNNGSNGTNGNQGNQGFQGNQGNNGSNGTNGTQGTQGNQGFQGNQGNNGSNGTNGTQGNQGFQGNQGNNGAIGNVTGTNAVTSIEVVSAIPAIGSRVAGRLYFLIG